MKETTFFTLVGCLSVISLASGIIGYLYEKHRSEKKMHGEPSTFRDVYEDNAPKRSDIDLMNEYLDDIGRDGYPY